MNNSKENFGDIDINIWEISYDEMIERLIKEFNSFVSLAREGKFVINKGLKARKKIIDIRKLLSEFREMSLEHQRRLKELKKTNPDLLRILEIRYNMLCHEMCRDHVLPGQNSGPTL